MTGIELVQEIVAIMTSGIVGLGQGIGQGISSIVTNLVYVTTGTGADAVTTLSPFAILVIAFCGILLAVGLTRLVYRLFTSFGRRNG